jgi:hypothetical protein
MRGWRKLGVRNPELSHEMTRLSGGGGRGDHASGGKAGAHVHTLFGAFLDGRQRR